MDYMELWLNDEYSCTLERNDSGFWRIPEDDARWLNLDEGDKLEVKRVWHEE